MPLLADTIRLEKPRSKLVIDVIDIVQPERVQVIPR
jgi:hypothetical protein